ncbi:hypothetical protein [Thalassovita mediterranea]|jgi:hypothetical protein|uniref:Lipoprotein n=1 Tax=Thalassovita mediterranea TaxID=340021 RepID=A0A0P1H4F7_9RHOB|nr:hypothetical protein [Thalassovita mediterranea]MCG7572294.1 hypothetical protein [Phaeobacter sp. CNT1-3]CUH85623.1 hypothetical protein TM5383_02857 [Thalassovita mediterranea]SIS30074.1 hypothetical protein SAMN05421685_102193 [Thalassovita mediterranea]
MRIAMICLMGAMALSGCDWARNVTSTKNRTLFDGQYFPTRLSSDRGDRTSFSITVDRVAQGLGPARDAGRYSATKHCVEFFGNSDVVWTHGPDVPDAELVLENGKMILTGRCDV